LKEYINYKTQIIKSKAPRAILLKYVFPGETPIAKKGLDTERAQDKKRKSFHPNLFLQNTAAEE